MRCLFVARCPQTPSKISKLSPLQSPFKLGFFFSLIAMRNLRSSKLVVGNFNGCTPFFHGLPVTFSRFVVLRRFQSFSITFSNFQSFSVIFSNFQALSVTLDSARNTGISWQPEGERKQCFVEVRQGLFGGRLGWGIAAIVGSDAHKRKTSCDRGGQTRSSGEVQKFIGRVSSLVCSPPPILSLAKGCLCPLARLDPCGVCRSRALGSHMPCDPLDLLQGSFRPSDLKSNKS